MFWRRHEHLIIDLIVHMILNSNFNFPDMTYALTETANDTTVMQLSTKVIMLSLIIILKKTMTRLIGYIYIYVYNLNNYIQFQVEKIL